MPSRYKIVGTINFFLGLLAIPFSALVAWGFFAGYIAIQSEFLAEFLVGIFSAIGSFIIFSSGFFLWNEKKSGLVLSIAGLTLSTIPF